MAPEQTKGGNTPKASGTGGKNGATAKTGTAPSKGGNQPKPGGQSAKDRSRAQSRSVTGKAPAGKGGNAPRQGGKGGGGGNTPRPGRPVPTPARAPRGLSGTLIAWGAVGLVLVIILVLVTVKLVSGSGPNTSSHQAIEPASATLVHQISNVPTSVFDQIGVNIPSQFAGDQPIVISGQPPLTLDGKTPTMMYYGAEYCPFCAAERWSMAVALARFGTWHGLQTTASGLNDGNYSTLTFRDATLDSSYIHFVPIETCTNQPDANATGCNGYGNLDNPTKEQQAVLNKYTSQQFVPGNTQGIAFPFVDINNKVLISGSTYEPQVLGSLTQDEIASDLTDPTNPVTQSIIGTANYITAAICASTGHQPANVCTSKGVEAAAKAMKLS